MEDGEDRSIWQEKAVVEVCQEQKQRAREMLLKINNEVSFPLKLNVAFIPLTYVFYVRNFRGIRRP